MSPKVNRAPASEDNAARRIAQERQLRGWTIPLLAEKVTAAGVPLNQSAVWKIESGNPRRRITLDEAVAFAEVFDMSLEQLLIPPEDVERKKALQWFGEASGQLDMLYRQMRSAGTAFRQFMKLMGALGQEEQDRCRRVIADNAERLALTADEIAKQARAEQGSG